MEPLLIILSTAIGTIVGVVCAVFMMQRRQRLPVAAAAPPQPLASVVARPSVTIEDLRKVLAERDQTLQQSRDDLEKKQQQLEAATAEVENAAALRTAAEQRSNELAAQASAYTEQIKELAAKAQGDSVGVEEVKVQTAALEAQLGIEKQQNLELTEQIARLNAELVEFGRTGGEQVVALETQLGLEKRQCQEFAEQIARLSTEMTDSGRAGAEQVIALETQLGLEKRQSEELAEQIRCLTIDLSQARQTGLEAEAYRSNLEMELGVSREKIMQLTEQVAELNRDRMDFEVRLREERQSAARGLELLTLVQSTLSGAFGNKVREEIANHESPASAPAEAAQVHAAVDHQAESPIVEHAPIPEEVENLLAVESTESVAVSA